MYSCGPHSHGRAKAGRPARTYIQPIRDVALRICRKQWTIGRRGERGSGISLLIVQHDDDDRSAGILFLVAILFLTRTKGPEKRNNCKSYVNKLIFLHCKSLSWSSCRATSTDIPDPLSPLLLIVNRFWQVLRLTSCILTELLYVGSSWSLCFCSAMWEGPSLQMNKLNFEFVRY